MNDRTGTCAASWRDISKELGFIFEPGPSSECIENMTEEADETFIRRLQFLANSLRRRNEPAAADDLEAVIRFKQSSPEEREEALWRDPLHLTLIQRLEKKGPASAGRNSIAPCKGSRRCRGFDTETTDTRIARPASYGRGRVGSRSRSAVWAPAQGRSKSKGLSWAPG